MSASLVQSNLGASALTIMFSKLEELTPAMSDTQHTPVTVLGLGAMGQALAVTLVQGGRPTTVWNRTPGKDTALVAAGATSAATVADAIGQHGPIIAVLLDHTSVHATLDPVADQLSGRQLINLTSTAPEEPPRLRTHRRRTRLTTPRAVRSPSARPQKTPAKPAIWSTRPHPITLLSTTGPGGGMADALA
ncbi:NAD(P)-binding domain-containing protein [Nocardia sp. NPDC005998]|uniref:NAD(P)-binding domain-containing protein n=1 Tax=Nocardia sp. NPDC005998 TaxID=3156894 RepID=UPI00339E356D